MSHIEERDTRFRTCYRKRVSDRPSKPTHQHLFSTERPATRTARAPAQRSAGETLLAEIAQKQTNIEMLLQRLLLEVPTKQEVQLVYQRTRSTRKLLDQHIQDQKAEMENAGIRHQALLGLLGEILGRLPEQTLTPSETETPSPSD